MLLTWLRAVLLWLLGADPCRALEPTEVRTLLAVSPKLSVPLFSIHVVGRGNLPVLLFVLRRNVPAVTKCRNSLVVEVTSTKDAIAADKAHFN